MEIRRLNGVQLIVMIKSQLMTYCELKGIDEQQALRHLNVPRPLYELSRNEKISLAYRLTRLIFHLLPDR